MQIQCLDLRITFLGDLSIIEPLIVIGSERGKKKTMKMTKKKIQEEEKEKSNPGGPEGVVVVGSTSITTIPPPDRISELPVEILHHILGFLEMDEFLIGTSLVSTKWRNLWKSVSTLNFPRCCNNSSTRSRRRSHDDDDDDDDSVLVDNGGGGIRNNVEKYQNFMDHVLRLRDSEASKIMIFKYSAYSFIGYGYLKRLHEYIFSAVNQGAQEIQISGSYLDLLVPRGKMIYFNPSIFTSLIRKFSFAVSTTDFLIQFPRSMCCSSTQLTHLSLVGIILPVGDDDDNAQLHLVCPLLEILAMRSCYCKHLKVLDISAPRLNSLFICNTGMSNAHYDGLGGCRIEIRTPNLTSLLYSGCVYVDCFTENLPHLDFASLSFTTEPTDMTEKTTSFAIKLLKGLTSAKSLVLEGFEVFSQDTLEVLLSPFTSLRTLELKSSCKISSIHGMVHILNSGNYIEKLVWEVDEFVKVEGHEHLKLPQCRLSHLKHVHIKNLGGHENEIEFVKFLLKSSVVLEDLIIKTTQNSPKLTIEENLKQFIEEETSFRSIKLQVL